MRENTKWIMLVTALAFVALMVFEWGMDMSGRSAGGVGQIGSVNGDPIFYEDYLAVYRNLYDQIQQTQEEPITTGQNAEIEDRAFDDLVTQILIRQELERRGIRVTDEEVRQAAQLSPPPGLASNPAFQTDGRFDLQKYQNFLNSQADNAFLLQLEAYYRDVIPRGKLLRQVSTGVHLSDNLLWRRFRDQNETVEVRYIPLDPTRRISDDSVAVSDAEVRAYYEEHQEDFEQPARASVKVVVLDKAPTAADSAASVAAADSLLAAIRGGEDFATVAGRSSGDQVSAADGGDLGVLRPGETVAVFDSALFAGPVGQAFGPVTSTFGHHLIFVDERWGQDSARASHILVPIQRTDDSEIGLLTLADSLEALGEAMPLDDAAAALGLTVRTAELTSAFPLVTGAGQVGEGADWALEEAEPGDVSPVFESQQAFYALELVSRTPGGILPLETARASIEQILRQRKKMELARQEGARLVEAIRGGESLPNVAARAGLEVRGAGPFARNDFVPGLGRQNAAIGAAFGLQAPGQVSDVVTTPDNAFVLELLSRTPADSTQWLAQRDDQRQQVRSLLQEQRLQQWLESLREEARIRDRRAEVLQPVDEDAPLQTRGLMGY